MPTRLYFHDAPNDLAGTFPSTEQSARTPTNTAPGATTLRKMDTNIGAGQVSVSRDSSATTAAQTIWYRFFTSPPLQGPQTVGGGSMTLNAADAESNLAMNHWIDSLAVYVWRPSTGQLVGMLRDAVSLGGAEPTAASSEQVTHITGIASTAVAAQDGDVIICEIWAEFTQGMAVAYTGTFYYDGTTENTTENAVVSDHASFLELAENLVFKAPPITGNLSQQVALALSAGGAVLVAGTLAQQVALALSSAGAVLIAGDLAREVGLSLSASGTVGAAEITGELAQEIALGLAATGTVLVQGELARTVALGLSAGGAVAVGGTLAQQVALALSAAGAVLVQGALAQPIALVLAATGLSGAPPTGGVLHVPARPVRRRILVAAATIAAIVALTAAAIVVHASQAHLAIEVSARAARPAVTAHVAARPISSCAILTAGATVVRYDPVDDLHALVAWLMWRGA